MKKFLPIVFGVFVFVTFFVVFVNSVDASNGAPPPGQQVDDAGDTSRFVPDSNVTFVGKSADRARQFLDLTLRNYDWACVTRDPDDQTCDNSGNPLETFWATIRNIIYAILVVVVLAAAFIMIATRGRSLTITRFIPRFILIIVLITFSFSLVQFLYQVADIIQGFFLRTGEGAARHIISTRDLIFIGFDYKNFTGLRLPGPENDESAFMTLLLVRLTAITYYVMTGVLIVRKIILWFFIVLSPVFPLLLFFKVVRNTAKIWIGEFFRWLLYGPLFAIFLNGLVVLWSSSKGIPLGFDFTSPGKVPGVVDDIVYPTAVNILIGGPGQTIDITNSANLQDTFALYVVALIMLWVVIILPFILLKVFLDFVTGSSFQNSSAFKQMWNKVYPVKPTPPGPSNPPPAGSGLAMKLPFMTGNAKTIAVPGSTYKSTGLAREIPSSASLGISRSVPAIARVPENMRILQQANLSVPKLTDIARYERTIETRDTSKISEVTRIKTSLERISNPNIVSSSTERSRYQQVRSELVKERQKGNVLASSILNAANVTSSTSNLHGGIRSQSFQNTSTTNVNNALNMSNASSISNASNVSNVSNVNNTSNLSTTSMSTGVKNSSSNVVNQAGSPQSPQKNAGITTPSSVHLPTVNKVQQVSIEDYEEVKKMWLETYESSSPPTDLNGKKSTRDEWINNDINNINQAITLLNSVDPVRVNEGMDMVSNILPFLMVGGFSKTEVVAYLKAKLEAGKQVLSTGSKKKEEEDSLLDRKTNTAQEVKHLETQAEIKEPEEMLKQPQSESVNDPLKSYEAGEKKLEDLRQNGE
ncbi:MAG: type IV secretion system protein [Candidatus Levybacteria bacterium]|nr:type IV secretion system protein [Candidatus Levybacteria bacterium]